MVPCNPAHNDDVMTWKHFRVTGPLCGKSTSWFPSHINSDSGHWCFLWCKLTGGNRTMVAAATIVNMAAAKSAQQNVFVLYHSYNRTILLEFIRILDFHFEIVLVLRRRYWFPYDVMLAKKNVALTMVAPFWFLALAMVARVDDDGCIISGG